MARGPTIAFYCTEEIQERLHRASKDMDRSVSWLVRSALDAYLPRYIIAADNGKRLVDPPAEYNTDAKSQT